MADANWLRKASPAAETDDDPFAELTKIMGFDPRVPFRHPARTEESEAAPEPRQMAAPNVDISDDDLDFSVDLEQELMGAVEPEEVAASALAQAAYQQAPTHAEPTQYAESTVDEPEEVSLDEQAYGDLEAALNIPAYQPAQPRYDAAPTYEGEPVQYSEQDEATFADYVAADTIEEEFPDQHRAGSYHDVAATSHADAHTVSSVGEGGFRSYAEEDADYTRDDAAVGYTGQGDEQADELSIDDELSAIAEQSYAEEPASAYAETAPAAVDDADESYEPAPDLHAEAAAADTSDYVEEADHSAALLADLDDALAASFESEQEQETSEEDWLSEPESALAAPAPQPQVYAAAAQEDDLAGGFDAAMAEVDMDFTAAPAGTVTPLATPFSLDNADLEEDLEALLDDNFEATGNLQAQSEYAQPEVAYDRSPADDARFADEDATFADEALSPDTDDADAYEVSQPAATFDAEDPQDDELQDLDFSAEDLLAEPEPVQEDVGQSDIDDAIAELAAMVRGYDQPVKAEAATESVFEAAPEAAVEEYVDIETIDVPEDAVALADDLDIPDVDYVPEAARGYDDIDAELAAAFGEPAMETVQTAQANEPDAQDFDLSSGYDASAASKAAFDAAPYAAAAGAGLAAARYAQAQGQTGDMRVMRSESAGNHYEADDFDFEVDPDLEDELALAGDLHAEQRPPLRRGLMIASIVGGIAVLGAIGAFAFSGGDGLASGEPVLVKADADPVKVKPENPGGAVVANTESGVFDRAAGEAGAPPKQDTLISTQEEPVDMAKRFPEELPQPVDESADAADGEELAAPAPKGEDRLEQTEVAEADEPAATEPVAVQPRKVRTMIVKADGSLVPREETDQPETVGSTTAAGSLTDPAISPPPAAAKEAPATTQAAEPAKTPPAAAATAEQAPAATGAVPSQQDETASTEASPPPAQRPRTASANTPKTVPLAPSRPADQPLDIVGEVKSDKVAALEPAASAAAGGYSMQIASQPSEAAAQSSYQALARRYGNVLGGRTANIVKAEIAGKGTFWRVRVPAGNRNEAVRLCEQYKSAGGNCFVSK